MRGRFSGVVGEIICVVGVSRDEDLLLRGLRERGPETQSTEIKNDWNIEKKYNKIEIYLL